MENIQEVQQINPLLDDIGDTPKELFENVFLHLDTQQNHILSFYKDWFEKHKIIGNYEAYQDPDILVVLGCNASILKTSMNYALHYLQEHPNCSVVLSGGGFSSIHTESQFMFQMTKEFNLRNPIFQEMDSMDTIGNVLFTKLVLKQKKMLDNKRKLLIITSEFHAHRVMRYFNTIYGESGIFRLALR